MYVCKEYNKTRTSLSPDISIKEMEAWFLFRTCLSRPNMPETLAQNLSSLNLYMVLGAFWFSSFSNFRRWVSLKNLRFWELGALNFFFFLFKLSFIQICSGNYKKKKKKKCVLYENMSASSFNYIELQKNVSTNFYLLLNLLGTFCGLFWSDWISSKNSTVAHKKKMIFFKLVFCWVFSFWLQSWVF